MENLRAQLAIFEMATHILQRVSNGGLAQLVDLNREHNVIRLMEVTDEGEIGRATLFAAQSLPSTVLMAFSIELCLKLLIVQDGGKPKKTHDLRKLFDACPSAKQASIRAAVCRSESITEDAFNDELNHNKDIFQNWRYFYELPFFNSAEKRAGIAFLQSLLAAAKMEVAP